MFQLVVIGAALTLTAAITAMCLLGGWIAAGLMPGIAVPVRVRLELYVSSAVCLATMGQVWLSAASG
jgi:hypothetical protein